MTKDKAKTLLDNLIMVEDNRASDYDEALRMAIAELEQEQDMTIAYLMGKYEDKEPCNDAISREAVVYYIKSHIQEIISESGIDKNENTNRVLRSIIEEIETMPSVTPSRRKGHWIQLDYQRGKFECSKCHTQGYVDTCMYEPKWKYCPICGSYNGGDEIGRSAEMVSKRCKGELYEGEFEER